MDLSGSLMRSDNLLLRSAASERWRAGYAYLLGSRAVMREEERASDLAARGEDRREEGAKAAAWPTRRSGRRTRMATPVHFLLISPRPQIR
eukprot:753932-Hanusia_phi.AAC.4